MSFLAITLLILASLQSNSTYTISGKLRDSEGRAAAGVSVAAYPVEDSNRMQAASGRSDSEGNFVIRPERPGKYILIYHDELNGHVPQYIAFFRDPSNPPPEVILTEATSSAQVDVRISKNGTLSGQALDAQTQLPIDNVFFQMCHAGTSTCWSTSAKSADGKFSISAPFVPFTLTVDSTGFEEWSGLTGSDRNNAISAAAGSNTSIALLMRRRPEAARRAISEAEKKVGINLPAPEPLAPEDNQIFDAFPRNTRLEWKPVEGAFSYAVEVDCCEYRKNANQCLNPQPFRSAILPPHANLSYEFNFIGAQPGRWRVWAFDNQGREGFKSSWRTFVYLK